MGFKISSWWKDLITKLILLYAALKAISPVYTILQAYFNIRNPLIPDYLIWHMTYPYYFLVPLWGFGVWFYYSALKTKKYAERNFWVIPIGLIVLWGIEIIIFRASIFFNPYGSP